MTVGDHGVVAWDPFNLVSRETLNRIVRDIDGGAARYDGGFSMPVRDDLDTFLPPTRSVPEPSALALLAVGVALIGVRRLRPEIPDNPARHTPSCAPPTPPTRS